MDVIHVVHPIGFVANQVFPEASLPDWFFSSTVYRYIKTSRKPVLYQSPALRKIIVAIGELPERMQMVGQNHDGFDVERVIGLDVVEGVSQSIDLLAACK